MKIKIYEIIIVMLVLFLLAACFGCKEKAEASEPNEPEVESVANWVEAVERWPKAQGYITDNFGRTLPMWQSCPDKSTDVMVSVDPPKPNEPTWRKGSGESLSLSLPEPMLQVSEGYSFNIWKPNDTIVVSLDFIPTWPDYIELEKDLIIQSPWYGEYWKPIITCTLEKGTKIFFKKD